MTRKPCIRLPRIASIFAVALLWAGAALAAGAGYPNRTITLVHGYGAGGSSDIGCRLLAEALREVTGQSVIVEPRPGALVRSTSTGTRMSRWTCSTWWSIFATGDWAAFAIFGRADSIFFSAK